MTQKYLKDLATQIESSLQSADLSERDRSVLEQVQSDLQAALAAPAPHVNPPASLRERLAQAVDRLEGEHPRLTDLLSKTLDVLSDVGI